MKIVHTYGYKLPVEFFALQSSSTSDEISTTIGGEEGLKKIVKAAQDGNRFWIEINKGDLCNKAKISKGTMAKMTNNEPVTLTVIEKICDALQCDIGDVVQIADVNKDRR